MVTAFSLVFLLSIDLKQMGPGKLHSRTKGSLKYKHLEKRALHTSSEFTQFHFVSEVRYDYKIELVVIALNYYQCIRPKSYFQKID